MQTSPPPRQPRRNRRSLEIRHLDEKVDALPERPYCRLFEVLQIELLEEVARKKREAQ